MWNAQIFAFDVFYCNLKEKNRIERNISEISIKIIWICWKLGLIRPTQKIIKLPSPKQFSIYFLTIQFLEPQIVMTNALQMICIKAT